MITIDVEGIPEVAAMLKQYPAETGRALEKSIDQTAVEVKDALGQAMKQVFDRPAPYTLNSLRVERTRNHNMRARVWFKEPDRMGQHYLVPQVEGGERKLKGFERALGGRAYMPSKAAKLDRYGNLPYGMIVQILSVLSLAEHVAGYSSNLTERSKKGNRKSRDYVLLRQPQGKLPAGVYQRVQTGAGFGAKTKKTLQFGEWQKGRTQGRFSSVIRARGLRPVLIQGKKSQNYQPLLPFYEIAEKVINMRLKPTFAIELSRRLGALR